MKALLLSLAFLFSVGFTWPKSESRAKSRTNRPVKKITYREHKHQKKSVVKKFNPKKHMFIGEGQVNGLNRANL